MSSEYYKDGWLEWSVEEDQRRKRLKREAKGDFGAKSHVEYAMSYALRPSHTGQLRNAFGMMERAGLLAAKEARFQGADIRGWDGELEYGEPVPFEVIEGVDSKNMRDLRMDHVVKLPPSLEYMAQIATRYWAEKGIQN